MAVNRTGVGVVVINWNGLADNGQPRKVWYADGRFVPLRTLVVRAGDAGAHWAYVVIGESGRAFLRGLVDGLVSPHGARLCPPNQ